MHSDGDTVALLMRRFREGDPEAAANLVELFYPQLKKIAAARMRTETPPHTWQATALVNELYLELVKIRALRVSDSGDEKTEFLKLAAHLMRRLLIHHARRLPRRTLHQPMEEDFAAPVDGAAALSEIDQMLDRLAEIDPKLRAVVELRVFEGLTVVETAQRTGCSERSIARDWNFARNWLAERLADGVVP